MPRRMGLLIYGGVAMLAFGVYRLITSDGDGFMDRWFDGWLFAFIGAAWLAGPLMSYTSARRRRQKEEHLFATGRRAVAVVESVERTTVSVNLMPMVFVTVRVEPEGEPPFTHRQRLVTLAAAMPKPGQRVNVAYDPSDRSDIAFETNKGFKAGMGTAWKLYDPAPSAAAASPGPDGLAERLAEQLAQLHRLRDQGALTDAEFAAEKAKLDKGLAR